VARLSVLSYWACILGGDEGGAQLTLSSLLKQTLPPAKVILINDYHNESVHHHDSRHGPRSSTNISSSSHIKHDLYTAPQDINLVCEQAKSLKTTYFMITNPGCIFRNDWVQTLTSRMDADPRIVVGVGRDREHRRPFYHPLSVQAQIIRMSFWNSIGGKYPASAIWQQWLFFKALEHGLLLGIYDDLEFDDVSTQPDFHNFQSGAAMYEIGYHPLYALELEIRNLIGGSGGGLMGALSLLSGYLQAPITAHGAFEDSFRKFVRAQGTKKIEKHISSLVSVQITDTLERRFRSYARFRRERERKWFANSLRATARDLSINTDDLSASRIDQVTTKFFGRRFGRLAVDHPFYGPLLYLICRQLKPRAVVETGVWHGISSAFILQALEDNNEGMLYSIDLPSAVYASKLSGGRIYVQHDTLRLPGTETGWLIPDELRQRWNLTLGRSSDKLMPLLDRLGRIQVFFHDSEHTYDTMMFEFNSAWRFMSPNGILVSDNVDWGDEAFAKFSKTVKGRVSYFQGVGMIIKSE
jgi:predicted O-methyltransferase YrrM